MKTMNDNEATASSDLMENIRAFERQLDQKAKAAGLGSMFIAGSMTVHPGWRSSFAGATLSVEFKAGHGMHRRLTTLVTDDDIGTSELQADLAENFVLNMQRAVARAPSAATSRRAIGAAAAAFIAEAGAEGIELEFLCVEPAPIAVFGRPRIEDDTPQVFYVHIVMPHIVDGKLTRDGYTIDADDAAEFAEYLRRRTLPELRELVRNHGVLGTAA